jgi:hypothetical protein
MAFIIGIDFRATSGFVTDQTNCFADTGFSYPTSLGGTNVGWIDTVQSSVDRNAGIDPRQAGINYNNNTTHTYRIDLPATGAYIINFGMGDSGNFVHPTDLEIFDSDNTTSLSHNASSGNTGSEWIDATGTRYATPAAWVTANPIGGGGTGAITLTFSNSGGTIACFFKLISASFGGDSNNIIAHFMIQQVTVVGGVALMGAMVM